MPNQDRHAQTASYLSDVFRLHRAAGPLKARLAGLVERATAAGLPSIAVTPDRGAILTLLASMTNAGRGARTIVEVGTLGGYSGLHLVCGLCDSPPTPGRLITIELEAKHADFAQAEFTAAGVAERVQLRRGAGLDVLASLVRELPPRSVDVLFLDAIKSEYPRYWAIARPLLAPGGLLIADNALGTGPWWITDAPGTSPHRDGMDALNRAVAADPTMQAALIANGFGLMVGRVME